MLQIGGSQLGGLTSEQSGGTAGVISAGDIKTNTGATDATIWMFGSANAMARLTAESISLTADHNSIWLANPSSSEQGAEINVTGDMTVKNTSGGTFMMVGNSQLNVGGDLSLDTTNGSFLATNNSTSNGINVGGDLTFSNNVEINNIDAVSTAAGIYSTVVNVGGDINVVGKNVGGTGLQILNATGTGITTNGDFNISSAVADNVTKVILGHASKVTAENDITLNSVSGGATQLYIGDAKYGAPTSIAAKSIAMSGDGQNTVIFNNINQAQPGTEGYLFNIAINGDGAVEQQSGHTTLAAVSNYTGGTVISGGLLSIADSKALGSGVVSVNTAPNTNTGLDIAYADGSAFNNILSGSGNSTVSGNAQITGTNQNYAGNWNVAGTASTDTAVSSTQNNFGTGDVNISSGGRLLATTNNGFSFDNKLTGAGYLVADNNGNAFNFSNTTGSEFAGNVILNNNLFALEADNTSALTNATLTVGTGNATSVGTGTQNIGGLAFNGGTLIFGAVSPGDTLSDRFIQTENDLNLTGSGQIQISTGGDFENTPQHPDTTLPLLQQDEGDVLVKLADSYGTVTGSAGNLSLVDQNGNVVSNAQTSHITQNGETVANGVYDYRLTSGENGDGLYINYGLTQLELLAQGNNALTLNAEGNTGNAADLSARVTGTGDLAFDSARGQTVSLSNMDNDYTGITDVRSGNLLMKNDNVLGQTSELRLAADTGFDMNGYSQTVGKLTAAADSLLNINGGSLTLQQGGTADGILTGSGALNINGDTLTITGENSTLTAKTTIAEGARVLMNTTLGLGTGDIVAAGTLTMSKAAGALYNSISDAGRVELSESDVALVGNNSAFTGQFAVDADSRLTVFTAENLGSAEVSNGGSLVLNSNTDWQLNNEVYGSGDVTKLGAGSITVGNNAAWTGKTEIEQGGLVLGDGTSPVTLASSEVNIAAAGMLSGTGGVAGHVNNAGVLQVGTGTGDNLLFTVGGDLVNSGTLATGVNGQQAGNQLVVNGNYTGNGGHLSLNTALGDDNSVTDKLVVKGDTSGTTSVSVTNAGGKGAATIDGIEVIHVDGASDGEFTQAGRIVAGAYDYSLGRGQDENSGNWYLTSGKTNPDPEPNPDPDPDKDLRPEGGSYTANLAAANNMFVTRLYDRLGETQYTDALTGEQKVTSMWMRHVGGHNNWRDGSGQLKTQSNRYVLQLGGDIAQWSQNGLDRWHLGVMAGYGNDHSNTRSSRTGYRSRGSVNGYSTGVYATWYANDASHNGAWLDSWAQYSWFDNNVKGDDLQGESYKSKGVTASLEMGYAQKMGEFSGSQGTLNEWYIQPQAQAVWMGVKADDHQESNGTRITSNGSGNVQTRLGLKTWIKSHHQMDNGKEREFQPFAELNWLHNSRDFSTTMDGVNVRQDGAKNIAEVKVGVEGQVSPRLNLWGNIGVQAGDKGYNDSAAMVGVKWNF
ncbi:autotransporter outer membrane beta-barrel domain-containing protein [Citrobacter sp. Ce119]|uniref:autotransporter outer membrane beta-barrel domain-containing protein n=1 Tax=Citrobacter sp. Ce119 TaxID=2985042 RepID=UPI00336BCDBD